MKALLGILLIFAISTDMMAQRKKNKAVDDVYETGQVDNTQDLPEAPKKTYRILVKNNLSADENFTLVGRTLAENDFVIDVKDKEFYTIKTAPKNAWKNSGRYLLIFSIKNNLISVTGQANVDMNVGFGIGTRVGSEAAFNDIVNKGMKGSFYQVSFSRMQDFAMKLGTELEYITQ